MPKYEKAPDIDKIKTTIRVEMLILISPNMTMDSTSSYYEHLLDQITYEKPKSTNGMGSAVEPMNEDRAGRTQVKQVWFYSTPV